VRAARILARHRTGGERRSRRGERPEHVQQLLLAGAADAAADPSAEVQPAVRTGHADQQAAQPAGTGPPAADHVVAGAVELHLDPVRRAQTRQVGRIHPLRHHALEPVLPGRRGGRRTVGEDRRDHPVRPGQVQFLQPLPADRVRQVHQVLAAGAEQVEDHVRDRQRAGQPGGPQWLPDVHPFRQRRERRPALRVEHHHLAVQQRPGRQPQAGQLRIRQGDHGAGAGVQVRGTAVEQRQDPDAVPLELVAPARAHRQRTRAREHRGQGRTGHSITIGGSEHLTQASH
jgi:hypothetical protein